MNPLMQFMNTASQASPAPQQNNIFAMAMMAMMQGKSPQDFLKSIPQLQGMDFTNINATAQKVCQDKGINYEQAKTMISSQINGMK